MMSKYLEIGISFWISLVIGLIALWTLQGLPLKYALSITLSLLVFFLINLYTKYDNPPRLTLPCIVSSGQMWLVGWFLAMLVFIIIKPLQVSTQFLPWSEIPWFTWVRLVASFMLTAVYPGYALITLIVQGVNLRLLEKAVLSVIMSLFVSAAAGFAGVVIDQTVGISSFIILLSVNAALFVLTSYAKRHERVAKAREGNAVSIGLNDIINALLFAVLLVFIALSVYSVNFPNKFVPTIDQWYHYGSVLRSIAGTLFSFEPYRYWTYMFEGLFVYIGGVPPLNAYMVLLLVLTLLPILCFYLMCLSFWGHKEAVVATTVYSLFSGFGGIYADYLRFRGNSDLTWIIGYVAFKTYDISAGSVSFSFYLFPKIIGFSTFFILVYLMYKQEMPRLSRCFFLSIAFALGYLSHEVEMYLFVVLALFIFLFLRRDVQDIKDLSYGFILGLAIVAVVDVLAPQRIYRFYSLLSGHPYLPLVGLILAVGLLYAFPRIALGLPSIKLMLDKAISKLSLPIVAIAIYVLALGIIVWIYVLPEFAIPYASGAFIWYLYPVRLGVGSFMAVLGAYNLFRNRKYKVLKFSLLVIFVSVSLERVVTYLTVNTNWLPLFPAVRIVEFTWVGVSLLASATLVGILRYFNGAYQIRKKFHVSFLILLLVAGFSSTLYNIQVRSNPQTVLTSGELQALDFVRNEIPPNVTILALGKSVNSIQDFAVQYPVMYFQPAIFGASTFETFVDILRYNTYEIYGHFPIRYFWLASSDIAELNKYTNGYLVSQLLGYLPIVYKNAEVTIFELPDFSPPSENSDLTVVVDPSSSNESVLQMLALAGVNYTITPNFLPSSYANIQILPSDSKSGDLGTQVCTDSGNNDSKIIVVFNSDGNFGKYANLLSLHVSSEQVFDANGVVGGTENVTFPNIHVPLFSSSDGSVKTIAYYVDEGKPVSPYAFYKTVNRCKVFYVQVYPYFEAMQQNKGTDKGRQMFTKLGDLVSVLGLNLPKFHSPPESLGRAILYGQATLTGNVVLAPQSFYIPSLDPHIVHAIGWQQDIFESGWSTTSNMPKKGKILVMPGSPIVVSFNASEANVWQYFALEIPNINVSQYPYLIVTEKIDASSYRLGFLRVVIGNYTYIVRAWTSETSPPGHPWQTYVFDLNKAVPSENGAPTPPRGQVRQIYWTAYSLAGGGKADLQVSRIILSNSQMIPSGNAEITASLDLSNAGSVLVDNNVTSERNFKDIQLVGMQISGTLDSIFKGADVEVSPPGLGGYSRVVFKNGCNITLSLDGRSKINLTAIVGGKLSNISASGGEIEINLVSLSEGLTVYMGYTQVQANGYSVLNNAFISLPNTLYDPGLPLAVDGMFSFRLNVMDQNFSLVSGIKISGTYRLSTQRLVQINELNIPWTTILTSPYNAILATAIIEAMFEIKRRHKL